MKPNAQRTRLAIPALAPTIALAALWLFALQSDPPPTNAQVEQNAQTPTFDPANLAINARPRAVPGIEKAAARRADELAFQSDVPSPFFNPNQNDETQTEYVDEYDAPMKLDVTLSSLMSTTRGPIAVIDGRPYRVGDRVADAAIITAINVQDRTVTLSLDDDTTWTLTLQTAGADRR